MAENKADDGFGRRYTVRVGDLCYVALGQIVNRPYTAVRYVPSAIVEAICVPKSKSLRERLKKEWGGLTADGHRAALAKDLNADERTRNGASVRLAYFYPEAFEPLALRQLARPTYDFFAVSALLRGKLYPAASAKDRKALVDAFAKEHGEVAREGVRWEMFNDLAAQDADEPSQFAQPRDPENKARECLAEVFGLPPGVTGKDRPQDGPQSETARVQFVETLRYDRSAKLDRAVRDLLTGADDADLAAGCMARLTGRGYDADIESYLARRLPKLTGRTRDELEAYRGKLGWTRRHAAVELGVPELIEAALKEAREVNARGRDGRTALHLAAADGHAGAVEQLLGAKADPNVKDGQGRSPVQLAAFADHPGVVRRLVAAGGAVPDVFTAVLVGDSARLRELLKGDGGRAKGWNGNGLTALHVAAREGRGEAARALEPVMNLSP